MNDFVSAEDWEYVSNSPVYIGREGNSNSDGSLSPYETCSYCVTEVLDSELTDMEDGSRICPDCFEEKINSDADHRDYLESIADDFSYRNFR